MFFLLRFDDANICLLTFKYGGEQKRGFFEKATFWQNDTKDTKTTQRIEQVQKKWHVLGLRP